MNIDQFRDAIRDAGMEPPEVIEPGRIQRFPGAGKRNGNTAAWCKLFNDGLGGCFGDWSSGFSGNWQAKRDKPLTATERAAFHRHVAEAQAQAEVEERSRHEAAAARAAEILAVATGDPVTHPYASRKRVSFGPLVKRGAWPQRGWSDALLVPLYGADGRVWSIEAINVDGTKDSLKDARKRGGFHPLGKIRGASRVLIAEGLANAAVGWAVDGSSGAAAMGKSNLLPTALAVRKLAPEAEIILLADNDLDVPREAQDAARAVAGRVAIPELEGHKCDFWDLWHKRGVEAVRAAMAGAPPRDQQGPSEEKATAGNSEGMRTGTRIHHDRTVTLRELFEEPEESAQWLVEELFPAGGFSVVAAKPKVGKSTLARQLAFAVARGEPFLGRLTTKGPVLYVALEEKRQEVRAHFRAMGAGGDESIHIYVASAPENAIAWLSRQIELVHPVLVIIDPLFRLARVRDASAYAEVTAAMEPLLGLARTTGAHVLVTHHATKRGEGTDAILGSTAIFGSVDTAAVLVRTERYRSIATTQRYGEDLSETVLTWDPDTHTASLGGTREEAEIDRLGKEILAYLSDKKEPVTEALIDEQVDGRTGPKKKALRVLVRDKRVTRTGEGKRGEPFLYVSSFVVPTYTGEPGNQKPKDDLSDCAAGGYSGSQKHADPGGSGNQQDGAKPDPGSWGTRI